MAYPQVHRSGELSLARIGCGLASPTHDYTARQWKCKIWLPIRWGTRYCDEVKSQIRSYIYCARS
jgi:hypothetical protein